MITFFLKKKSLQDAQEKKNFIPANPSSSEGLERRLCFMLNGKRALQLKHTVLLIILSSLNMYFIHLSPPFNNHRCRANLVYEQQSSLEYSTLAISLVLLCKGGRCEYNSEVKVTGSCVVAPLQQITDC